MTIGPTGYFVCTGPQGDHSLLYRQAGILLYGILAGKPQRGGYDPMSGVCAPDHGSLRVATDADFAAFRVHSAGFFTTSPGGLGQ